MSESLRTLHSSEGSYTTEEDVRVDTIIPDRMEELRHMIDKIPAETAPSETLGYSPEHPYTTEEDVEVDTITSERMEKLRRIANEAFAETVSSEISD